jgi:DNA-binding CsgD family transcriptional regulator
MFLDAIAEEDGGVEGSRAVARRADDLVRRCYSGLRGPAFQAEVVRAIHALLPVDAVFLATADPGTLLFTGIFAEEPLVGVADRFLDNEFGQDDVNKFQSLAAGPRHVATLDSATHGGRAGSARYRDIMAPLGLGDELRAALVTPSGCWGYLCLHRAESPHGFTPAEVRMVGRLAASLGNGCRLSLAAPGTEGIAAIAPGVVVLHPDHTLAAITGEAERLLADVADYSSRPGRLPAAVYAAAACLQSIYRGTALPTASPTVRVRTTNGSWLLVHATHLHGTVDDDIAVIIEAAHPSRNAPLVLRSLGLTPREAEVALLVLRGASTKAIGAELHLSAYTVKDHLKSIFDKAGVRSRRDLMAQVLTGRGPS